MTTRNSSTRLTTRLSASLWIPKMAMGPIESPECTWAGGCPNQVTGPGGRLLPLQDDTSDQVADTEEHKDHRGHDEGHDADRGQKARTLALVHKVEARATASLRTRSATRYIEPVASTAPSGPASCRARSSAAR